MTGRRITILGMGPSAYERRHDIERYCETTEIWSLNNAYNTFPKLTRNKRFTRFYEIHSWAYLQGWEAGSTPEGGKVDHWGALDSLQCQVYCGHPLPFVKRQTLIDWEAFGDHWHNRLFHNVTIYGDFGPQKLAAYFRGSPSTILALALMEHDQGDRIEYMQSWGIDTGDPQHKCQRAAWSFWISQALARGIEIGGTMAAYMFDVENDDGLKGLQDMITEKTLAR